MTYLLEGQDLSLTIGGTAALQGASVGLDSGEIVAVLGSSGSGKSTLLHCLAGILRPASGSVWFQGRRLDSLADRARSEVRLRSFGFVFQFGDLVPELTLRENVALPLRLLGQSRQEANGRTEELLERLEIRAEGSRLAAEVSGGQAQRAAVARSLATRPAVVFADEPTGALDRVSGELVLNAFIDVARSYGSAVVLVTHEARVAAYADREIVMSDGRSTSADDAQQVTR